jgi:hypothetical protein
MQSLTHQAAPRPRRLREWYSSWDVLPTMVEAMIGSYRGCPTIGEARTFHCEVFAAA